MKFKFFPLILMGGLMTWALPMVHAEADDDAPTTKVSKKGKKAKKGKRKRQKRKKLQKKSLPKRAWWRPKSRTIPISLKLSRI